MNNFIKVLIVFFICVFIMSAFSGCKESNSIIEEVKIENKESQNVEKYKIGLVMKTLTNPFFVKMEDGARKAEEEFDVDLIVKTGTKETSIEQQIQIVENLISQNVDAIVIAPGSSVELVKVLKKAQDNGIKIVNIDNKLDKVESEKQNLTEVPFISVKNDEGAYLATKELCKDIEGNKNAVIIEGIRDAENAKLRKEGAEDAFLENNNVKIIASETANWKIDEAYEVFKEIYSKNSDIDLVFCANDMMALGVIEYLKEIKNDKVKVASFDNLDEVKDSVLNGDLVVTIDQQADIQGYKGVEIAMEMLKGNAVESEIYIPIKLITKNSFQE
jgi:ribose transport system substrate-binding protein